MTDPALYENLIAAPYTLGGQNTASVARRHGRGNLSTETKNSILPIVETWTKATDANGVAFPGGLIGVRTGASYTDSDAAREAAQVAVPATLPAGYTPRNGQSVDWFAGPGNRTATHGQWAPLPSFPAPAQDQATSTQYKILGETALYTYTWLPENVGGGGTSNSNNVNHSVLTRTAGYRYIRCNYSPVGSGLTTTRPKVRFRLGYMIDGTLPPNVLQPTGNFGVAPDVVAWEYEHATASVAYDTGFLIHDGATYNFHAPTFGTRICMMLYREYWVPSGSCWDLGNVNHVPSTIFYSGPRLDLALPFSVVNATGSLVAPGGVVPGVIPGY